MTMDDLLQRIAEEKKEPASPSLRRSQLAGQRIRELRKGVTLGGISIKDHG